jgi:hypothetical protein
MTTLQDNAVGPASRNELISPARLLLLAPSEPRAPIAILSPAKRNALVACFNAGGLHKKDGAWHGPPDGKPVSGMTTADLARDGMLTVTTNHRFGSAQLTERGNWFARTLLCQGTSANSESVRFGSCSLSQPLQEISATAGSEGVALIVKPALHIVDQERYG